jgi:hypothetical protein
MANLICSMICRYNGTPLFASIWIFKPLTPDGLLCPIILVN